ncbi:hypothetical protein [Streptomyces vastus]|uniref:hypothetical protein n=1 Tax=Streptomyces vastus TaxID=285451 RepID=UPI0031D9A56C
MSTETSGEQAQAGLDGDLAEALVRSRRTDHRAGLELLRLALRDAASPWAHVLDSVSATLPALAGDERTAVMRLAAQGPPEEQVGLDPYAPPTSSPVFLPDPVVGGPR